MNYFYQDRINYNDAIAKTSYSNNNKSLIGNTIQQYFSNPKISVVFLITRKRTPYNIEETIFVIEHHLHALFGEIVYKVSLLIYLPNNFPNSEPDIFIEKKNELSINPNYTQFGKIREDDLRINISHFIKWESSKNLGELFNELTKEFNKDFPCYKGNSNKIYDGECTLEKYHTILVDVSKMNISNNSLYYNPVIPISDSNNFNNRNCLVPNGQPYNLPLYQSPGFNNLYSNYLPGSKPVQPNSPVNNNNNVSLVFPNKNNVNNNNNNNQNAKIKPNLNNNSYNTLFSEKDVIAIIKREIKNKISFVVETTLIDLNSHKTQIEKIKRSILVKENNSIMNDSNGHVGNIIKSYSNLVKNCSKIERSLTNSIMSLREFQKNMNMLTIEKIKDMVEIRNENYFKYLTMENTLFEFLHHVRKLFEKNSIPIELAIKYNRQLSRELFFIKYLRVTRSKIKDSN